MDTYVEDVGQNGHTKRGGVWIGEREIIKCLPYFNQSEYINHYVINYVIKLIMIHKNNITSKETQKYMEFWSLFIVHGRQQYPRLQSTPTDENRTNSHNRTHNCFLIASNHMALIHNQYLLITLLVNLIITVVMNKNIINEN